MNEELKPVRCGCGGEAVVKMWAEPDTPFLVMCEKCKASSGDYSSESEAIEAWNRAMGERTAKVEDIYCFSNMKYGCCSCGKGVHEKFNYCPSCGAKLDWSGNE